MFIRRFAGQMRSTVKAVGGLDVFGLIAPKVGSQRGQTRCGELFKGSVWSSSISKQSILANFLNRTALPSIKPAWTHAAPIVGQPAKTAVRLVTTAHDRLRRVV